MNPENKTLIDKDSDIFTSVVKYYNINKVGEGEEGDSDSSEDEVKDINIITTL